MVFEDPGFAVVVKPSGLLSVPGKGPENQDCVTARIKTLYPDCPAHPEVHRLDMDTSGLILFALSPEVQRNISLQFEKREISKTYVAIVEGVMEADEGRIDYPMRKDMEQRLPPKHIVDCVRGKKALTEWKVLERREDTTRVALFPKTGRSHQLRVHMQHLGYPIVGDYKYGAPKNKEKNRLHLHAYSVTFPYGNRQKEIMFKADITEKDMFEMVDDYLQP